MTVEVSAAIGSYTGVLGVSTFENPQEIPLSSQFVIPQFTNQATAKRYPDSTCQSVQITDLSTVKLIRHASTEPAEASLYLVRCTSSEFSTQQGSGTLTVASGDLTIDSVDPAKSFVIATADYNSTLSTDFPRAWITAQIIDSTHVRFAKGLTGGGTNIQYQVVEFHADSNVSVQTSDVDSRVNIANGFNATLSSTADLAHSFVYCTFRHGNAGLEQNSIAVNFIDGDTLKMERYDQTNAYTSNVVYNVLEFPTEVSCYHVSGATATTGDSTWTHDFSTSGGSEDKFLTWTTNSCNGTGQAHPRE